MRYILSALLVLISSLALGDSDCPDRSSDEALDTFCSQTASALRVQLRALKILRKHAETDNSEAIHYLESQASLYRKSLAIYAEKVACQTRNVESVTTEADEYAKAYGPKAASN